MKSISTFYAQVETLSFHTASGGSRHAGTRGCAAARRRQQSFLRPAREYLLYFRQRADRCGVTELTPPPGGRFMVTKPIDRSKATHANGGKIGLPMTDAEQ